VPTPNAARSDRAGLKTVVTFVDPEIAMLLKVAAAESYSTVQRIVEQAIITSLRKTYGKDQKRGTALEAAVKRTDERLTQDVSA